MYKCSSPYSPIMFGETWEEITDFKGLTTSAFHNVVTLHLNFEESILFTPLEK